jgi:hypothetical protein
MLYPWVQQCASTVDPAVMAALGSPVDMLEACPPPPPVGLVDAPCCQVPHAFKIILVNCF